MKKKFFAAAACSLALLFGALPVLAACGTNADGSGDAGIVFPEEELFPETPETPDEAPEVSEDGEEDAGEEDGAPSGGDGTDETPEATEPAPEPDAPAVSLQPWILPYPQFSFMEITRPSQPSSLTKRSLPFPRM